MNNPGDFVPPRVVPAKQPLSCWLIGGIGCLVICLLVAIALALAAYQVLNSKTGKQMMSGMGAIMQNAERMPEAKQKMNDIHGALLRYDLKNGQYPLSLAELSPDYLANGNELHCTLDPNPDPTHISFTYFRPTPEVPSTSRVLTIKWSDKLVVGKTTSDDSFVLSETIGGQITLAQYTDGKLISAQVFPSS
jgi:hypothetical protein